MRPEAGWGDRRLPAACARMGSTVPFLRPKAGGPAARAHEWGYLCSRVARRFFSDARAASGHARARAACELAQSQPSALADLAVLLVGPSGRAAELATADAGDLSCERKALIGGQLAREALQLAQLLAHEHDMFDGRALVDDVDAAREPRSERRRLLERGVDRASSAERSPAVAHARQKTQLDRVGDVGAARELPSALCVRDELERRLAEAVLEILVAKSKPMRAQEQLATCARDLGDLVGDARAARVPRTRLRRACRCSCFVRPSGRHMWMSSSRFRTPPSQLPRPSGRARQPSPERRDDARRRVGARHSR